MLDGRRARLGRPLLESSECVSGEGAGGICAAEARSLKERSLGRVLSVDGVCATEFEVGMLALLDSEMEGRDDGSELWDL